MSPAPKTDQGNPATPHDRASRARGETPEEEAPGGALTSPLLTTWYPGGWLALAAAECPAATASGAAAADATADKDAARRDPQQQR